MDRTVNFKNKIRDQNIKNPKKSLVFTLTVWLHSMY